jgi:predicted RNA polymerase sigma factor
MPVTRLSPREPQCALRAAGRRSGLNGHQVDEPALKNYHLLPSVRGDLLFKLSRYDEARVEFLRAADMTRNAREREFLLSRAAKCG